MTRQSATYQELICIIIDDEPHAIAEFEELAEHFPGIKVIKSFSNARDAISYLHVSSKVDVIFSDINMPGLNGIDAAKVLQSYCHNLIYVTAYRDYALDAIHADAKGYLMKPLNYKEFAEQIIKLRVAVAAYNSTKNDFTFFKGDHKNNFFKIMYDDIIYIKGMQNYVQIFTQNEVRITHSLLGEIEEELKNRNLFIRIAKSIIISFLHLNHVEGNMAYMEDGTRFPVGIPYRQKLTLTIKAKGVGRGEYRI